ncbi:MFS transporter [Photorhabdus viridis]|uniref:MFS transporter n=1 Tax=Photorhabdus viridis TaxID=3163327 RepID=UPI0033074244
MLNNALKTLCFSYFFSWAIFLNFYFVIAEKSGLSANMSGIVSSISFLARTVGLLTFYPYLIKHFGTKGTGILLTSGTIVACVLLLISTSSYLSITCLIVIALFLPIGIPITESILVSSGLKGGQYETIRLFGSFGFIISIIFASFSFTHYQKEILVLLIALPILIYGIMMTMKVLKNQYYNISLTNFKPIHFYVFSIVFLIHGSHAGFYVFGAPYFHGLGFNSVKISAIFMIGVMAEIGIFKILSSNQSMSYQSLLLAATLASIIRWGVMITSDSFMIIFISAMLHGITFGATHIAFIRFIKRNNPSDNFISSSFLVYGALLMSLSLSIVTFSINSTAFGSYFTIPVIVSIIAFILVAMLMVHRKIRLLHRIF